VVLRDQFMFALGRIIAETGTLKPTEYFEQLVTSAVQLSENLEQARRECARLREALEAAEATLEDEQAAHAETLTQLRDLQARLGGEPRAKGWCRCPHILAREFHRASVEDEGSCLESSWWEVDPTTRKSFIKEAVAALRWIGRCRHGVRAEVAS
jgi:hypothetical protein